MRRRHSAWPLLVLRVGLRWSRRHQPAASEADLEAINKLRQDFVSARNTGDTAGLLGLWTDDGVWMRPNETAIVGRKH